MPGLVPCDDGVRVWNESDLLLHHVIPLAITVEDLVEKVVCMYILKCYFFLSCLLECVVILAFSFKVNYFVWFFMNILLECYH